MRTNKPSLVLLCLLAGLSTMAMADDIACPLERIVSDVTTRKPAGWWSTPKEGVLQGTDIVHMGDKQVLVCHYGVGSIMRDAPPGAQCRAVETGFHCDNQGMRSYGGINATAVTQARREAGDAGPVSPRPSGLPGRARLPQSFTLDLDSGRTRAGKASDIWFMARSATDRYLKPINGATMAVVPRGEANLQGCLGAHYSRSREIPLARVAPDSGNCVCAYTNNPGTLAAVCVDGISEERGRKVLELSFGRWYN